MQSASATLASHARHIEALIAVLDEEHRRLEALRALLRDEQQAIRALALEKMTVTTTEKLKLLDAIRVLEERRSVIIRELAEEWAIAEDDLTLRAIAARAGALEAGALLRRQEALTRVLTDLRDANAFNGSLLAGSLACFQHCLTAWQSANPAPTYSEHGTLHLSGDGVPLVERQG